MSKPWETVQSVLVEQRNRLAAIRHPSERIAREWERSERACTALRTLRERYEGECVWMQDPLDPGCQKTSCGHFIFMTREKMKHRIVDCNETRCPSCGKPIVEASDDATD